jgi:hypothetical protein
MAAVFSVVGRTVTQRFIEFAGPFPGIVLESREYRVRIEAKVGHQKNWVSVVVFNLRAQNMLHPESYISYSNDPGFHTADELAEGKANGKKLLEQLQRLAGAGESQLQNPI